MTKIRLEFGIVVSQEHNAIYVIVGTIGSKENGQVVNTMMSEYRRETLFWAYNTADS